MKFIQAIRDHRRYAKEWRALKGALISPHGEIDFDKVDTYLGEKSRRAGKPGEATGRVLKLKGQAGAQRVMLRAPSFFARRQNVQHRAPTPGETAFVAAMRDSVAAKVKQARSLGVDPQVIQGAETALDHLNLALFACAQKSIDFPYFRQYNAALVNLQRAVQRAQG